MSECIRLYQPKYTKRPSPPYPANKCPVGTIKEGNDGNMYIATASSSGINRWVRHKKTTSDKKAKVVTVAITTTDAQCVRDDSAKYIKRPSPPYPANKCPVGTIKEGNDGNMYIATASSSGINRWVRHKKTTTSDNSIVIPIKKITQDVTTIATPSTTKYDIKKGVMEYSQLRPRQVQVNKEKILGRFVNDFYASIKYDGWQGVWDGDDSFMTKTGKHSFTPPESWAKVLPKGFPITGELIIEGKQAPAVASLKKKNSPDWSKARFMVFDLPSYPKPFEERTRLLKTIVQKQCKAFPDCPMIYIDQIRITSVDMLYELYKKVIREKGEGLVLTKGSSMYTTTSRTSDRVKFKGRHDHEGKIIGYNLNGSRLKSLIIEMDSGKRFNLGIGFKTIERENYKKLLPMGKMAKYSFRELSSNGLPKEARFVGLRQDV